MEKTISFKKDLLFKTEVHEINNIDLEQSLMRGEIDHSLSGEFRVHGDYKMTVASVNTEPFEFTLPFDITVDPKYDTENAQLRVDDFRYELINNEILRVNLEVTLADLKEVAEQMKDVDSKLEDHDLDEAGVSKADHHEMSDKEKMASDNEEKVAARNDDEKEADEEEGASHQLPELEFEEHHHTNVKVVSDKEESHESFYADSIFNNINHEEKYVTYNIYQMGAGDDLHAISEMYETDLDTLRAYNDVEALTVGDRLIIPKSVNEEND